MDQQFSLSWNNFHGNLSNGFAGLLGNGEFVDVTIAVEGHLLQAHKVILSICSPYFKKMFQLNPCQHPIVVLRDVTHKAMRDLLQFMYHGEVSVKREDLTSFISTAEVLQIKGLTNKETDEENFEAEKEVPKQSLDVQRSPEAETGSDVYNTNSEASDHCETELLKQREFIEKLQRISNLKRKSDEYLQKKYYTETHNLEKRPKPTEKYVKINQAHQKNNFENIKSIFEDNSLNITKSINTNILQNNTDKECNDKNHSETSVESPIDLKMECDDNDIIVSDPAVCTTPKSYDSREVNKVTTPVEYQSPQDNCTGLSALFMDLKNLVNGKFTNTFGTNGTEEMPKHISEHRLVTIPQKEDGKKKYPQRSCRLCWRIGKRRDTRFMCSCCELPFCKAPCFEIHFHDVFRVSQLQGDYYAT
ncbi:transcription regulator protein BACH1-like isoform X1 [Aricia agestis]|uniref:transcription regulator protein BACH1-like isoform X1 n=1 Tax=Aricia agestis TaxID=91739 RepID=UPI001C203AE0|nr:transcription regulator protein BACH1-like isoform X1 [Aricia agestis]XP_041968207.1 transcription regulator protein BACH1-like isoform X1 [Aricia agestis]